MIIKIGPGLKKVQNMLKEIPKKLQKEVGEKGSEEIAKSGQRMIIYKYQMAGYHASGFGRKMLGKKMQKIKSGNSYLYTINIPEYLGLIEEGVSNHPVSFNIMTQHMKSPGSTLGMTAKQMGLAPPYWGKPKMWFWKGPFIDPGLKAMEKDIPRILERSVTKAIAGARKWCLKN